MNDGIIWVLAGLFGLIAESLMPGVFLLWLGLAAILTGAAVLGFGMVFAWQVSLFVALALVAIAIGLQLRRRTLAPRVNTIGSGLIGRAATALSFTGQEGRVRVGDSDWPARLVQGQKVPEPGAQLRITGIEGTRVLVQKE